MEAMPHFHQGEATPGIGEGGGPGNDPEALDLGQGPEDLFRDPLGQMLLIALPAQVQEGQDGHSRLVFPVPGVDQDLLQTASGLGSRGFLRVLGHT